MYLSNGETTHETDNPIIIDAFKKSGYTEAEKPGEIPRRGRPPKDEDKI